MTARVFTFEICKFDYFNSAVADMLRAGQSGAVIGSFVLGFCGIDYMGRAMNPTAPRNTSADFKAFVSQFLALVDPIYSTAGDSLWAARNSLIHTYGLSESQVRLGVDLQFTFEFPQNHLRTLAVPGQASAFWLNLPEFIGEVVAGTELFFRAQQATSAALVPWYQQLMLSHDIADGFMRLGVAGGGPIPYRAIHPFLAILERRPQAGAPDIRDAVATCIRASLGA